MIPKQVLPTMPDMKTLRALFDEDVAKTNTLRRTDQLHGKFYAGIGDAVFEASSVALSDFCKGSEGLSRVLTVPAPMGSGKTSFACAYMSAMTRYAKDHPEAPYGCALLVEQIASADAKYRDLSALMPDGEVAVWTSAHDTNARDEAKEAFPNPAAQFAKKDLANYPVIVVTHNFYNGRNGDVAKQVMRPDGTIGPRALIVIDERPSEVDLYETTHGDVQRVRKILEQRDLSIAPYFGALASVLWPPNVEPQANVIARPDIHGLEDKLRWFASPQAEALVKSCQSKTDPVPGADQVFGVAKALAQDCVFQLPVNREVKCIGWQTKFMVRPGMVLLDATSSIDGLKQLCSHRRYVDIPTGRYDNLEIIHIGQHTKRRLSEYFNKPDKRKAYASWLMDEVKAYTKAGETALVVCKKKLFDEDELPREWTLDNGRTIFATHWGSGIGSNEWKDVDVVFLFDEHHLSNRVTLGLTQGYQGHNAKEGVLANMKSINEGPDAMVLMRNGHKHRWTMQMALRGKGRVYDENGVCGKQRLVISSDLKSFSKSCRELFPGAKIARATGSQGKTSQTRKVLEVLGDPMLPIVVTTRTIADRLHTEWRKIASNVVTPDFETEVAALGWRYDGGRGRRGARFERLTPSNNIIV
jgi:hypothetical protein